eukprot:2895552-Pleurochrysis_carterae.AAC.1
MMLPGKSTKLASSTFSNHRTAMTMVNAYLILNSSEFLAASRRPPCGPGRGTGAKLVDSASAG